jgi:hypothetical protein
VLVADRLVFTTSDTKVEVNPPVLRAAPNSELNITVFKSNIFGFKVPFSKIEVRFAIEEGANLISLANEDTRGSVIVRSKGFEGEAAVGIYFIRSGFQIKKLLIKILPRDLADFN